VRLPKSGKAPVSFVLSFSPQVHQRCLHWADFREICYWGFLRKSTEKSPDFVKNGHEDLTTFTVDIGMKYFAPGQQWKGDPLL
jgi:hypothetical protein